MDTQLSLFDIAEVLIEYGGCKNRVIHFASCSTLDVESQELSEFVDLTEASAVSGYKLDVDWAESTAFELNYLQSIQYGGGVALTPAVMKMVRDGSGKHLPLIGGRGAGPFIQLGKHLGFVLKVKE